MKLLEFMSSHPVLRHGGVPGQQEDPNFEDENWLKIRPQRVRQSPLSSHPVPPSAANAAKYTTQGPAPPIQMGPCERFLWKSIKLPASTVMFKMSK